MMSIYGFVKITVRNGSGSKLFLFRRMRHAWLTKTKKVISYFKEKIRWHHHLPHRVTPALVTPLLGDGIHCQTCDEV